MITNDQEYQITKEWLARFTQALADIDAHSDADPQVQHLRRAGVAGQVETLQAEIAAYQAGVRQPVPVEDMPLHPLAPLPPMGPHVEQELRALGRQYQIQTQHDLIALLDQQIARDEAVLPLYQEHLRQEEQFESSDPQRVAHLRAEIAGIEEQADDWRRQRADAQREIERVSASSVV